MTRPWPGPTDPIVGISYELLLGFDPEGQPEYGQGRVEDEDELREVQRQLTPVRPHPGGATSVTMGTVGIELESGARLTLRPVFHPPQDTYGGLFKIDHDDCPMPEALADRLNRWRERLLSERPTPER